MYQYRYIYTYTYIVRVQKESIWEQKVGKDIMSHQTLEYFKQSLLFLEISLVRGQGLCMDKSENNKPAKKQVHSERFDKIIVIGIVSKEARAPR